MSVRKTEMIVQAKALEAMGVTDPDGIIAVGAELREIVNGFECLLSRPPTTDEIVWVFSERRGKNMRVK